LGENGEILPKYDPAWGQGVEVFGLTNAKKHHLTLLQKMCKKKQLSYI
jgi:hypothetical protein